MMGPMPGMPGAMPMQSAGQGAMSAGAPKGAPQFPFQPQMQNMRTQMPPQQQQPPQQQFAQQPQQPQKSAVDPRYLAAQFMAQMAQQKQGDPKAPAPATPAAAMPFQPAAAAPAQAATPVA